MTTRQFSYGVAAMVGVFIVGSVIGGTWDDNDTAGAITVALWAISIIGVVLLLAALVRSRSRRRTS